MGYWGWRPLLFCAFVGVLIVACTDDTDTIPTTTPTNAPVTLTVRPPIRASVAPPGLPAQVATMPPATKAVETSPALDTPATAYVIYNAPTCYATGSDGILCLGSVQNPTDSTLTHIVVEVDILSTDGTPLGTAHTTLPQRVLPPGEHAPYRALFSRENGQSPLDGFAGVQVEVEQRSEERRVGKV